MLWGDILDGAIYLYRSSTKWGRQPQRSDSRNMATFRGTQYMFKVNIWPEHDTGLGRGTFRHPEMRPTSRKSRVGAEARIIAFLNLKAVLVIIFYPLVTLHTFSDSTLDFLPVVFLRAWDMLWHLARNKSALRWPPVRRHCFVGASPMINGDFVSKPANADQMVSAICLDSVQPGYEVWWDLVLRIFRILFVIAGGCITCGHDLIGKLYGQRVYKIEDREVSKTKILL